MSILSEVIDSTRAIIQGMSVTLSYIPKRKQTVEYPEDRSEEHTSELQSHRDLHSFPTRRSSDLILSEVIDSTRAIIQGMSVTLSYIPKRKQTVEYPED